ncbi:unnamed protein product [Withania somnifera]
MPMTDNQGSFLNRISIRRNQVSNVDQEQDLEDLELFQKHVAERFSDLLPNDSSGTTDSPAKDQCPLFSISWYRRLLDVFLCCEAEFKALVLIGRDPVQFSKPPLDRLVPDILDRSIKSLDICNAVTHGLELVRHWQKLAQIAVTAFEHKPMGDGQVRRAKKALNTLLTSMMLDDKENNYHAKVAERTWSFGRRSGATGNNANNKDRTNGTFRAMSWSVAKSWSSSKQPTGLALPIYAMSTTFVFVMWGLVAAIPCQERTGLLTHFPMPRNLNWGQALFALQEKIGEEWKKKEKKGTTGLLDELQKMEKVAQNLVDFAENFQFPGEEEKMEEVAGQVAEMAEICLKMEEGLVPLQQQIREVFHRIVRSRVEVLDVLDQIGKMSTPVPY